MAHFKLNKERKGENMLSEQLISQYREDLQREKKKIQDWLGQHPVTPKERPEKEDRFYLGIVRYNHHATTERLLDVTAALGRIEEGTFGVCIDCKEEIQEGRLLILPFAKRCISCHQKMKTEKAKK